MFCSNHEDRAREFHGRGIHSDMTIIWWFLESPRVKWLLLGNQICQMNNVDLLSKAHFRFHPQCHWCFVILDTGIHIPWLWNCETNTIPEPRYVKPCETMMFSLPRYNNILWSEERVRRKVAGGREKEETENHSDLKIKRWWWSGSFRDRTQTGLCQGPAICSEEELPITFSASLAPKASHNNSWNNEKKN